MKRLTTRQRLERLVMRVAYPPLDGMGAVVTVGTARHLLELEHRRLRAKVRKLMTERGNEYMKDATNKKYNANMQALAAGRAWAIKDLRDDLLRAMR